MIHPVKTPLGAARAVTHASLHVLRHPFRTVTEAAALGRGIVASVVTSDRPRTSDPSEGPAVAEEAVPRKRHGDPLADEAEAVSTQEPGAPATADEPPASGAGQPPVATEPSRVAARGDDDEIPSPVTQPEDDDVEVTTPVGTTGAGPGFNPDTTESDLQQPGTEPLMDPSTTKRIKRETETLRKASEPKKK